MKEKMNMKNKMKTLLGVLLALTMAVGLLPGMLSTAHADGYCPYCGSTNYGYNGDSYEYDCYNCGESFDTPSATPPGHQHAWHYGSDRNTIEANCYTESDCPDGYDIDGIILIIHAPSSLVCDGNAKTAWISGSVPDGLGLPEPSGITYSPGGSTAPTEAGTYTASFTWGGKTASVSFTLTAPEPTHTHSWDYLANGATVTASCGQGCDITEGLSITISAPSGTLTYDGNGKAASLSTGYNTTAFPGSYSISYTKNGSPVSGTPTEAGAYTASFTVGTATGSVDFSIKKADPTYTAPTGLTATYGQTLANVTLPTGWTWADDTQSVGDAGINNFNATFTPSDTDNYNVIEDVSVSITVSKADPVYTAPTGLTATYGDTLADVTLPTGWTWADDTQSVGDAGINNFNATFTPSDTDNYNVIENVSVSITVNKADPIANVPTGLTATYGDTLADVTLTNPEGNTAGAWAWADSTESVGDAGSHTFQANFTPNDTANYNTASADVTVTVGKKAASVTADEKSKTYGDADPALTAVVTGTVGSDTLNYTLSRAEGNNAGEYAITVTLGQNPNYDVTATGSKLTIGKRAATVTAEAKSKTYGAADPTLTAVVSGTVGSDTLNYTLSRAEGSDVGEYAITVTLGSNPNYDVTATGSKLTIGRKAATVTADWKSKTYGETDPTLTAVVTGTVDGDEINYTLSRDDGEDVGDYAITVTLGDNPDYDVSVTGSQLTISKKEAAVTAEAKSKAYGEADPELTAVVTGAVDGDEINYTLTREAGEDVGEYTITVTLGSNLNYDVTATDSKLTIGKKAATVTADAKSKTYGEADPELTAVVTGADKINYTLSRAEGEDTGEYPITVTLGENPNYDVSATGSTLTIGKKTATVTADAKSKTYGEADPELTAAVTGADKINYTLSRAAGENAGEYAITVTLGSNPNYDVTATGSKLIIGKKAATVTADEKSKTYGEPDPELTAVVTGAVGEDKISYTLSRKVGEDAGEHEITVTPGQNPNYDVTAVGSKLTIGKKAATVTANDTSKTEGEDDPLLAAYVTGTVGSDQILYSLHRALGEKAGTYTIFVRVKDSDNPNYNVTAVNGVLTVNAAPQPEPEPEPEQEPQAPVVVTVPVSGDEATANVTVTVEESIATVSDTNIDEVLSAQEVGTVTVDMSALETEITEVVIPNAMLTKVAEAVADENNSADSLEIKLTEATIHFDAEAVAAVKEQAGEHDLHVKLDIIEEKELNQAQQEAVKEMNAEILAIYDAYMILDGQRVDILGDGKATVTVKAPLKEGQDVSGIRVFAVDDEGNMDEVAVTYENEEIKFDVEFISKYVMTYDQAEAAK